MAVTARRGRGLEIDNDLLQILDKTNIAKANRALQRAVGLSRQNVSRLRSTQNFNAAELTENLEEVARSGVALENTFRQIKKADKNDPRIRFLANLLDTLDLEKRALSSRLNRVLSGYRDAGSTVNNVAGSLAARKPLRPVGDTGKRRGSNNSSNQSSSTYGDSSSAALSLGLGLLSKTPLYRRPQKLSGSSGMPAVAPMSTSPRGQAGNNSGLDRQQFNKSMQLDRTNSRRDTEYQQQQSRFLEDSNRKVIDRLDKIVDRLGKIGKGGFGGGGGGSGFPDVDIDFDRKDKRGRGSRGRANGRNRLGKMGLRAAGLGAIAGNALNQADVTDMDGNPLDLSTDISISGILKNTLGKAVDYLKDPKVEENFQSFQTKAREAILGAIGFGSVAKAAAATSAPTNTVPVPGANAPAPNSGKLPPRYPQMPTGLNNTPGTVGLAAASGVLGAANTGPGLITRDADVSVNPNATLNIITDKLNIDQLRNIGKGGVLAGATTLGDIGGGIAGGMGGFGQGGFSTGGASGNLPSARGGAGANSTFTPAGTVSKPTVSNAFNPNKTMTMPTELGGVGTREFNMDGTLNPYGFTAGKAGTMGSMSALPGAVTSNTISSSGGVADIGQGNSRLSGSRQKFIEELNNNPQLKDKAVKAMLAEGGSSRLQNNMEQLFNYADMRGVSIDKALHSGQFGPVNRGEVDAKSLSEKDRKLGYDAIDGVGKGSNNIGYRTDQGMLSDPGARKYMQDPEKYGYSNIKGNNFFYHGEKGIKWAENQKNLDKEYADKYGTTSSFPQGTAATPNVIEKQGEIAATRRLPIQDGLKDQLQFAAEKAGVQVEVGSGGQAAIGSGGPRTGSTRHDNGGAADVKLYATNPDGSRRLLNMDNPDDAVKMEQFTRETVRAGATGVGAGNGYMGPSTLHVGGGSPAFWGGAGFIPNAFKRGMEDREGGKAEFEAWRAARAAAVAKNPEAAKNSVTAGTPETSSMFAGQTAPADVKSRSLSAQMRAYTASSKENEGGSSSAASNTFINSPLSPYNTAGVNTLVPMNQRAPSSGFGGYDSLGKGITGIDTKSLTPTLGTPAEESATLDEIGIDTKGRKWTGSENDPNRDKLSFESKEPTIAELRALRSKEFDTKNETAAAEKQSQKDAARASGIPDIEYNKDGSPKSFYDFVRDRAEKSDTYNFGPGGNKDTEATRNGGFNLATDNLELARKNYQNKEYEKSYDSPNFMEDRKSLRQRASPDEFTPSNSLSIAEIKAFYGPNASTSGISESIPINSYSASQSEGSTRQSAAPAETYSAPAAETTAAAPAAAPASNPAVSDPSINPIGGGSDPTIGQIPVRHEDLGLSVLNAPDIT